ncbi:MAG: sulfurtransferase [Chloroflexota bacterium]
MGISIVSPGELRATRPDWPARTIVVDARSRKEFLDGHVPGALWMGWEEWSMPAPPEAGAVLARPGYWGVLAAIDPETAGARLASLGLRDDAPTVVYGDGTRTRGAEGRIAWMLLYFGARDVALVDGGWSAWLAAGGAAETGDVPRATGTMSVRLRSERRRTLGELRTAYREGALPLLIDTRSPAESAGDDFEYLPRRGHLPGAESVPFADLFASDGRYVSKEHYLAHLPAAASGATQMVAYCEVGVRAALFALLHEAYTGSVVAVYDGSLMEWGLQSDLPVETGLVTTPTP